MQRPLSCLVLYAATLLLATTVLTGRTLVPTTLAQEPERAGYAAKIDDTIIPWDEVDRRVAVELYKTRLRAYTLRKKALERMLDERLIATEAERRGISVDELLQQEVEAKAKEVTPEEVEAYIEEMQLSGDLETLRPELEAFLAVQKRAKLRQDLVERLMQAPGVSVNTPQEPDPPRVDVATEGAPVLGSPDAPVTIVEFSEFQCPFCRKSQDVLKKIKEVYGERVKFVFKHFPINPTHRHALKAAEAGACTQEQGSFWRYHDRLFTVPPREMDVPNLKAYAAELGLDTEQFNACLEGGKYEAKVAQDVNDGLAAQASATPTFYISGWYVAGAQPFEVFEKYIERALSGR
jgi:protein-disulfide isomerase